MFIKKKIIYRDLFAEQKQIHYLPQQENRNDLPIQVHT